MKIVVVSQDDSKERKKPKEKPKRKSIIRRRTTENENIAREDDSAETSSVELSAETPAVAEEVITADAASDITESSVTADDDSVPAVFVPPTTIASQPSVENSGNSDATGENMPDIMPAQDAVTSAEIEAKERTSADADDAVKVSTDMSAELDKTNSADISEGKKIKLRKKKKNKRTIPEEIEDASAVPSENELFNEEVSGFDVYAKPKADIKGTLITVATLATVGCAGFIVGTQVGGILIKQVISAVVGG